MGALAAILLVGFAGLSGALLGGLFVRFFVPQTGMGWDRLADALGGLMVGGLLGIVAGAVLAALLSARRRMQAAAGFAALAVATFVVLAVTAPERPQPSAPVVREEPFRPFFVAKVGIGNSDAILLAVPEADRPFAFTEMEVRSGGPSLERVGWGPDLARCRAEPSRDDLAVLLPAVEAAAAEATGTICRTPREDDLNLTFYASIDGERKSATVQGDCLAERPAMAELARALGDLAARLCAAAGADAS